MPEPAKTIQAYGVEWKTSDPVWPELRLYSETDAFRAKVPGALSRAEHMTRAIKLLLPEGTGLVWHGWIDDAIDAWCRKSIMSWWGPSSAGKSSIAGLLLYVDLLANPAGTYTVLVTDTLKNHEKRCWSQVIKWRSLMPKKYQVGKLYNSLQAKRIVTTVGGTIAGIHCTFIDRTAKKEDLKDKLGGHNLRNRLCVDEAQACGDVCLDIKMNLGAGGEGWLPYREVFIGNPDDWSNTLGQHSMPADGDKEKTTVQHVTEWETTQTWNGEAGVCITFDARNSPARRSVREAERLHFLPSVASLENLATQAGGEDSRAYWTYAIGRIPPVSGRAVLLSEADVTAVSAGSSRPWADDKQRQRFVGIDTSTGQAGSDGVPLVLMELGETRDGLARYDNGTQGGKRRSLVQIVTIESAFPNVKMPDRSGQIVQKIVDIVKRWGVDWGDVAISQGGQEAHIVDRLEAVAGCPGRIKRINPAGPATKRIIKTKPLVVARDRINTRAAELALNLAELIAQGSICRVPAVILQQMGSRGTLQIDGKADIQPKEKWSAENKGASPDEMDAAAVIADHLISSGRLKLGEPVLAAEVQDSMPLPWMQPKTSTGGMRKHLDRIRSMVGRGA